MDLVYVDSEISKKICHNPSVIRVKTVTKVLFLPLHAMWSRKKDNKEVKVYEKTQTLRSLNYDNSFSNEEKHCKPE